MTTHGMVSPMDRVRLPCRMGYRSQRSVLSYHYYHGVSPIGANATLTNRLADSKRLHVRRCGCRCRGCSCCHCRYCSCCLCYLAERAPLCRSACSAMPYCCTATLSRGWPLSRTKAYAIRLATFVLWISHCCRCRCHSSCLSSGAPTGFVALSPFREGFAAAAASWRDTLRCRRDSQGRY